MAKDENKQAENVEENNVPASSNVATNESKSLVNKPIVIDEDFVDYILALPGKKPYENTKADSRNHKKFFRTFNFISKEGASHFFNVEENEVFCNDYDKQNLFEVRLIANDQDFYNLAGYKTYSRAERQISFKEKRELHQVKLTLALGNRAPIEEIEDL